MTGIDAEALESRVRTLEQKVIEQKAEIEAANLAICIFVGEYARRLGLSENEVLRRFEGFWSTPMEHTSDMHPVETDMQEDLLKSASARLLHNIRNLVRMTNP